MAIEIPLFPLNAVLFPHMPMALHIFEERYRAMMRDCTERGTTFGILALREGREVGPGAKPYRVGTLAQVRDVETLRDGRSNIVVAGASRFRVDRFSSARPYLVGAVTYLQDAPADAHGAALALRVTAAFREYLSKLRAFSGEPPPEAELPDEPELLSYLVAAALQVTTADRQRLLEIDSASARLQAILTLLRRELVLLEHMVGGTVTVSSTVPLN